MSAESIADKRLHPATIWLALIRSLRSWLVPGAVLAAATAIRPNGWARLLKYVPLGLMILLVVGGITLLFAWMAWRHFRYGVGEKDIVIEHGLFTKVRRSIPLARVQDVNIEQGPLARLFGVTKVKIETGGGAKDEGLLDSVSMEEAEFLRRAIREPTPAAKPRTRAAAQTETPEGPLAQAGEIVFSMTLRRLLIFGLFSFSLFYLAAVFALVQTLGDLITIDLLNPRTWRDIAKAAHLSTFAFLILAVAVLGIVFGAGRAILRDYGFTLWKEGRRFRRERGLITRSQVVVPLPRVQLARMSTTPLRRLFGWFDLSLQTLGGSVEDGASGRQAIAPFARQEEIAHILTQAGPFRLPPEAVLTQVSSRRLWKKLAPLVIPTIAVLIVSLFFPLGFLGLIVVAFAGAVTALEWRHYRYAMEGDLLFVRDGFLRQHLWIAPPTATQTITLRRSFLQRRLGLATVVIDTAGATALRPLQVDDLREDRARELIEQLQAAARPAVPSRRRRRAPEPKPPP